MYAVTDTCIDVSMLGGRTIQSKTYYSIKSQRLPGQVLYVALPNP